MRKNPTYPTKLRKLALVIPAHNEELAIASTIRSAMGAGQSKSDIYVVDDNSSDQTYHIASQLLGKDHVLKVKRSGKALAIQKAVKTFELIKRYEWIHISDADGVFGDNYFTVFKRRLNRKYAAACGHVQSLPGGWVSQYRIFEYTIGLEIMRRIQNWLGTITVIPGPTSCFRSDIFPHIEFSNDSMTEDFDATIQIHRKKLGKIGYFPDAKSFTQDPKDYRDFVNQVSRWYRGFFQVARKHRIGFRTQRVDAYILYMNLTTVLFTLQLLAVLALAWLSQQGLFVLSIYILTDVLSTALWVTFAAALNKRWDIFKSFPLFYVLRFTNLYVFYKAFVEIIVLRKFNTVKPGWDTAGRRYRIQTG
ncbi:glycosyltransferase family 2 protein [bacterium]|nr:glycosyltransferase family 2 protein [bacterium]